MTQHTTGPWTAKGPDISAADGTRIATCGITRNYAANARLLAAAPELLDLLMEVRNKLLGNDPSITSLRERTDELLGRVQGVQT